MKKLFLNYRSEERLLVFLLVLLSILPIAQSWSLRNMPLVDDALITLTYSRNLAEGNGFVFNAPPPVLGTTTPLWTFMCAILYFLFPGIQLTTLAVLCSGFFWVASVWTIYFFRHEFSLEPRTLFVWAAIISGLNWPETLGMEGYLFMFLLLLALGFYLRKKNFVSGLIAALLFLTRGEGILLLGILLLALLIKQIKLREQWNLSESVKLTVGFIIPFVIWIAYALPTFQHILPNTLTAKLAQAKSGLWLPFWDYFWKIWLPDWKKGWQICYPWINLWLILFLLGLIVTFSRKSPLRLLMAWLGAYFLGYSLLGVAAYGWYMLPIVWIGGFAVAEGVSFLSLFIDRNLFNKFRVGKAGKVLCLLFALIILCPAVFGIKNFHPHPKCRVYMEMSRWFAKNASPQQSISFFEVGYLGYFTRNRIIDQMGLVTAGNVENIARRDFASNFWRQRPDYLVVLEGSGFQYHIVFDPRFKKEYVPVASFGGLERPLIIFCRR